MFSFQGASSSKSAFVSLRFRQSLLRLPKTALHCAVSPLQSKPTLLGFWLVGFDCWISKRLKETSTFVAASFNLLSFLWWRLAGSNRWPPACKAGALPAELNPRIVESSIHFIPFPLFLLPNSNPIHWALNWPFDSSYEIDALSEEMPWRFQHAADMLLRAAFRVLLDFAYLLCTILWPVSFCWWAKMDSNHRPHDYQSCALASWAIGPYGASFHFRYTFLCTL